MGCNPIDKGIAFNCDDPPQGGVEARGVVMNFDDYRQAKKDGTVTIDPITGELTSIVLPSTKQGYAFQVPKGSNIVATEPLRQVDGIDGFDHTVQLRVATIEKEDLEQVSKMRFNKVVIIVELSEGRSKLYGGNVGLRLSEYDSNIGGSGTGATVVFTASTDSREAPEVNIPDLIASTFDLETLLVPAP